MKPALYNEIEPYAARWLRQLSGRGLILRGDVDARSIRALQPKDFNGRTQAHFFAGIGVWSYALRLAGWPDGDAVWTGSCPCQPFSLAGAGAGFADDRHLWPDWFSLIRECRPPVIFGEQVASPDGLKWLDLVSSDLEGCDYTGGAAVLPVAGVGAPHGRHRIFFVAFAGEQRRKGIGLRLLPRGPREAGPQAARRAAPSSLADSMPTGGAERGTKPGRGSPAGSGAVGDFGDTALDGERPFVGQPRACGEPQEQTGGSSLSFVLGDSDESGRSGERGDDGKELAPAQRAGSSASSVAHTNESQPDDGELQRSRRLRWITPNPLAGFWADADWIYCRDEKYRPVEPGSFPLAHGITRRVGRLRAYGNAISPEAAAVFIRAAIEAESAIRNGGA